MNSAKISSSFVFLKPDYDDDVVDRLNYIYTVMIFLVFSGAVAMKQFVGEPLQCWVPKQFQVERYLRLKIFEHFLSIYRMDGNNMRKTIVSSRIPIGYRWNRNCQPITMYANVKNYHIINGCRLCWHFSVYCSMRRERYGVVWMDLQVWRWFE